jgi:hypothetical protein
MHALSLAGREAKRVAAAVPVANPLVATLLVGTLLVVSQSGCTMCPSPYDYSGPVPNGSAPQNDFRARSNGILPLGGQPRPWPPVVQATPAASESPTLALPLGETPTVPDDATWLVAAAADADPESPRVEEAGEEANADAVADGSADAVPELLPAHDLPQRPEPPARVLRESDGWRPKR